MDTDKVDLVFREALGRMDGERRKYGEFDPETDQRDLLREAEEELLDTINYLAMQILRLRTMKESS